MKSLMNQFNNNHALVAGAYNGGPGRMRRWLEAKQIPDLDEFVEDIWIDETRRHIKKSSTAISSIRNSTQNLPLLPRIYRLRQIVEWQG